MSIERAAKEHLNDYIYKSVNGVVISGPFKGMRLIEEVSWEDGNLGTKVLGCYEQELHDTLELEIARLEKLDQPIITDIGCSEGYYAVGLKLRLPNAIVMGIDISTEALRLTELSANANGVDVVTNKNIVEALAYPINLVVCDCEGGEIDYLDPEKYPGLKTATIIVECHDTYNRPVTEPIGRRFQPTHEIWCITEASRNPNAFELLRPMNSLMRWLAVCEGRPVMMHWLVMRPRGVEQKEQQQELPLVRNGGG
jgi:hypothetical protein